MRYKDFAMFFYLKWKQITNFHTILKFDLDLTNFALALCRLDTSEFTEAHQRSCFALHCASFFVALSLLLFHKTERPWQETFIHSPGKIYEIAILKQNQNNKTRNKGDCSSCRDEQKRGSTQ